MNKYILLKEKSRRRSVNSHQLARNIKVFPHQGYQLDPPQSEGSRSKTLPLREVIKVQLK